MAWELTTKAISPAAHTAELIRMMRFICPNPFSPVWLLGPLSIKAQSAKLFMTTSELVSYFGQYIKRQWKNYVKHSACNWLSRSVGDFSPLNRVFYRLCSSVHICA